MNFTDPKLRSLLDAWAALTDLRERAEAHNIAFEERLDRHRLDFFEGSLKEPCVDHEDLRGQLIEFVKTYNEVDPPHVPQTFGTGNRGASMAPMSPEQKMLRVEDITGELANAGLTLADLEQSVSSTDPAVSAKLEVFLDQWDRARDNA